MRNYKVHQTPAVTADLERIEEFLANAYHDLGYDWMEATERVAARLLGAHAYMRTFARHPHRGTEHPAIRPGLRSVTKDRFVYYVEIDEALGEVRVLAVFFGGADHTARMRDRLGQA